jgi:TatA/E family protein of Tat protein translocase
VDILGIGPLELVLILVIALLVFGPDKLPEIGAKMGKGVRELRQLSREISQGVNTITEPLDELRKPFDEAGQIAGQVTATAAVLSNPAQALQRSLEKQLTTPSAEPAAADQTAAVQTAEDNTIAPPRSPEPAETIEPMAPDVPPSAAPALDVAVDTLGEAEDNTIAPPRAPEPVEPTAAAAVADPPTTESAAQTPER